MLPPLCQRAGWEDSKLASAALPWDQWLGVQAILLAEPHTRVEVLNSLGEVVGGVILMETLDAQVGYATAALHQFLLPEYRHQISWRKVLRACELVAKETHSYLIWSHRKEESGRIFYTYKEV